MITLLESQREDKIREQYEQEGKTGESLQALDNLLELKYETYLKRRSYNILVSYW